MMVAPHTRPPVLDRLTTLADGVRSRILLVVEGRELTVSELCAVLRLPQSTVSRHLKILVDAGWISTRPEGPRRLYLLSVERLDETGRELWRITRSEIETGAAAREDARRLESVLARRGQRSREFFAGTPDRWEAKRDELFGTCFYLRGLLGLLDPQMALADLGCGTGPLSEAVAPVVRRVIAVDGSEAMLAAARRRLERYPNVELRRGELEALPLDDRSVDAATLVLVLPNLAEPARALSQVARVLRRGGRVLLVDLLAHEREELRQELGHVWLGFDPAQIEGFCARAGLRLASFVVLPDDPAAQGPPLFVATAIAGNDGSS